MRLAVDAANLASDRRGMGRIVRAALRAGLECPDAEITLLVDKSIDARSLRAEFPGARIQPSRSARRRSVYDVVWYPFNGMRFRAAAPSLVTMHDAFAFSEPHPDVVARLREQRPIRRAAALATQLLTDSQWSCGEIVRRLEVRPERIAVIHPMPDAFWFPGAQDVLPPQLQGRRYAVLVGAREPRKNARLALAAAQAALAGPGEALAIVGALTPELRAYARALRLNAGEIAAGDRMLRALYRNASAVLVPSLAEGYGLVTVEAMACGAPVIASNTSALPEAAGGAALLLDPRDEAAWARAIRAVFDDGELAAGLRARGAARFAAADRTQASRATLALLQEVALRAKASSASRQADFSGPG